MMTMPVEKDLYCYKGQTYKQSIYFKQDGQPIDLTGTTAKAQIRPSENSKALTAEFDVTVDGSAGKVALYMSDEETGGIPKGTYFWDLRMEDEHDEVAYYIKGKFILTGRVTV